MRAFSQAPDVVLRALSERAFGRLLIGGLLYGNPGRMTAEATYGDALALKRARAFEAAARAGITYPFASPGAVPTTIASGPHARLRPYAQAPRSRPSPPTP